MSSPTVSVIIPAYNEAERIASVIERLDFEELIVVDDASTDSTAAVAQQHGATVIAHEENRGYITSLLDGFEAASGDILVTIDADGEHNPDDVPRLIEPIQSGEADVVFGTRDHIPRPSERLLNWLARLRVAVPDTGTGFRALRAEVAAEMELDTECTCGTFALEATTRGAELGSVRAPTASVDKPRSIAWGHTRQVFHVLRWLLVA